MTQWTAWKSVTAERGAVAWALECGKIVSDPLPKQAAQEWSFSLVASIGKSTKRLLHEATSKHNYAAAHKASWVTTFCWRNLNHFYFTKLSIKKKPYCTSLIWVAAIVLFAHLNFLLFHHDRITLWWFKIVSNSVQSEYVRSEGS